MRKESSHWLASKLKVAKWMVLERISRGIVAEAILKAPVQLALMVRRARLLTADADKAAAAIFSSSPQLLADPDSRQYPAQFDINPQTEDLLRRLVMEFMPRRLVETGVANGVSTRVILSAMDETSRLEGSATAEVSVLHSLDISSAVVTSDLRAHHNWRFHLVDERHSLHADNGANRGNRFLFSRFKPRLLEPTCRVPSSLGASSAGWAPRVG